MAKNYAAGQPVGNNQMLININTPAPFKAIDRVATSTGATSTIGLTVNTTAIEVAANGRAAFLRWVPAAEASGSVTGTSFDHVIPDGQVRRFVVPIETGPYGVGPNQSAVGIRTEIGGFSKIAVATDGTASVYTTQYGSSNSY